MQLNKEQTQIERLLQNYREYSVFDTGVWEWMEQSQKQIGQL